VTLQEESLRFQQLTQAATLVGTEVAYTGRTSEGLPEQRSGAVSAVAFNGNQITFEVGSDSVRWSDIQNVRAPLTENAA
jgi:hypothetical protein